MPSDTETLLSQRLRALRVEPPDAVGFSRSLRARLDAEVAATRGVVQLSSRRRPKRVITRRMSVLLSVAAICVGGSAFALVGPRILAWVGLKEPEVRSPLSDAEHAEPEAETPKNRTRETRPTPQSVAVPEAETQPRSDSTSTPTAAPSSQVFQSSQGQRRAQVSVTSVRAQAAEVDHVPIAEPPSEASASNQVHVPRLSVDLVKGALNGAPAQPAPELQPIEVPRLDPERPRVVNPDTNQLRDNSLRETLRRNRAGKSD